MTTEPEPPEVKEWINRINAIPVDIRKHVVFSIMATHLQGSAKEHDLPGILAECLGDEVVGIGVLLLYEGGVQWQSGQEAEHPLREQAARVLAVVERAVTSTIGRPSSIAHGAPS